MAQAMKPLERRARLCSALTTIVRSSRNCTSFSEGLGSNCPKPSIAPSLGSVATTKRCAARPSGFMLRVRYKSRAEGAARVIIDSFCMARALQLPKNKHCAFA